MIGAWIIIGMLVLMLYGIVEFLVWVIDDHSMTKHLLSLHKKKNELYQCSRCRKLYRMYQMKMYEEVHGYPRCPHCESSHSSYSRQLDSEKWMNTHPDCPKINWLQYLKIKETIKKMKASEKIIAAQQFFEEYNNIKVDFNWIENLQKKYK